MSIFRALNQRSRVSKSVSQLLFLIIGQYSSVLGHLKYLTGELVVRSRLDSYDCMALPSLHATGIFLPKHKAKE